MPIPKPAEPERPLPVIDLDNEPFWNAVREHRLVLQRCAECLLYRQPPMPMCPHCNSFEQEWVESTGRGKVHSWEIVRVPSHPFFSNVPYNVVLVEMDEGPRLFGNLLDVDPEDIHDGMSVRVDFVDIEEDFTLYQFRAAKE